MKKTALFVISLITANFLFSQSGSMNLGSATTMTIAGGKVCCTNLKMESGASLLENGNLVFGTGGNVQIKRNITGSGIDPATATWHYIGSPSSAGTANTFFGGLVNWYNEPPQKWIAVTNPNATLSVGKGYSVAMPSTGDVTYMGGVPNYGDKIFTGLTCTGNNSSYSGWHLLSNPFPCAIEWTASGWNRINITSTVYTYDGSQYKYYTYPNQGPPYGNMPNGIIPAEQGFMIKVMSGGGGGITIPQTARVHSSQDFYKTTVPDLLTLEIKGNGYCDQMLVHFDQHATEGFDAEYDAFKLFGIDAAPQLYSMIPDIKLAGNVLSAVEKNPVIQIGLQVGAATTYKLTAGELESFASGTSFYLEDLLSNKTVKLNDTPVYSFTATPEDVEHRFNLHFNLVGIPEQTAAKKDIQIYSSQKDVYLNIPFEIKGTILIYNLLGNQVVTIPAKGNSLNKISLNTSTGYYVVKVVGDTGSRTGKVFIN
jgi:trimeric autotransporter adhesin